MATIKPIEGRSVHQIQSGQVIIDLCSVVKELVENSLDASATSIDVRFKNNGFDSIEVQDNGGGVEPEDFETLALKHHTSKLSSYNDLSSLKTFGFRGEALSSLCALSNFHVVTARASDGPKGTRLDFESSGKLKGKSFVAATRGTTVTVDDIFKTLPVRRKELERNVKREYQKVLYLLNAYACISTGVRFVVSNQVAKGKRNVVFSTNSNATTRENIANVFSAKTLLSLLDLDLKLELQPTSLSKHIVQNLDLEQDRASREVRVVGHISRPVVGEGRQTPDRQMFFVNSRPCSLPQVAKAINEVYKSYNVTQSPFIFADLKMDTNSYDVNVSPDKRTIYLHDQTELLEAMKESLITLFESHEQSVPQAQLSSKKVSSYRSPAIGARVSSSKDAGPPEVRSPEAPLNSSGSADSQPLESQTPLPNLLRQFVERNTKTRDSLAKEAKLPKNTSSTTGNLLDCEDKSPSNDVSPSDDAESTNTGRRRAVRDFNARLGVQRSNLEGAESVQSDEAEEELEIPSTQTLLTKSSPGVVKNAFDHIRPQRSSPDTATITIGNTTTIATIGSVPSKRRKLDNSTREGSNTSRGLEQPKNSLLKSLRSFAAPGSQLHGSSVIEVEDESQEEISPAAGSDQEMSDRQGSSSDEDDVSKEIEEVEEVELVEEVENTSQEDSEGQPSPTRDAFPDSESEGNSDDEYADEDEQRSRQLAQVARMIEIAEETAARPTEDNLKRVTSFLKSRTRKDTPLGLMKTLDTSVEELQSRLESVKASIRRRTAAADVEIHDQFDEDANPCPPEEQLSLSVSKSDFKRMQVVGQFNLGFIVAIRPKGTAHDGNESNISKSKDSSDELFIIDQHASDEKFNFERLQAETMVQNQRLVNPKVLDLSAVEEEIILNHSDVLTRNGFLIETDLSGDSVVGRRCRLVGLPMSQEVIFNPRDLEELLALLSDHVGSDIPRPSKVRRMFAMRACRSSIMVGKALTVKHMERVIRHMGEIDKPWNCPHGRPTMRHLFGLNDWDGWTEGDGLVGMEEAFDQRIDWNEYLDRASDD